MAASRLFVANAAAAARDQAGARPAACRQDLYLKPDPIAATARLQRGPGAGGRDGVLGQRRRRAGQAVGEVCFNTAMTGYQEILTDPSYAGQIITFTFPHIGNVGTNPEDIETTTPAARGLVIRNHITAPANWRATKSLDRWLEDRTALSASRGVDTRRLTRLIRDAGRAERRHRLRAATAARRRGMRREAAAWPGLEGMDLANEVTCRQSYEWDETVWRARARLRHGRRRRASTSSRSITAPSATSCACSRRMAAGSRWCRRPPRPRTSCATEPDGDLPVERAGRPGGDRRLCGAGVARADRDGQADLRHLPRPSDAGAGARRPHPQDGQAAIAAPTTRSRTCRPARSRSPARTTALSSIPRACRQASSRPTSRCSTAPTRGCASRASRSSRCSTTPKPAPARRTAITCSSASSR